MAWLGDFEERRWEVRWIHALCRYVLFVRVSIVNGRVQQIRVIGSSFNRPSML